MVSLPKRKKLLEIIRRRMRRAQEAREIELENLSNRLAETQKTVRQAQNLRRKVQSVKREISRNTRSKRKKSREEPAIEMQETSSTPVRKIRPSRSAGISEGVIYNRRELRDLWNLAKNDQNLRKILLEFSRTKSIEERTRLMNDIREKVQAKLSVYGSVEESRLVRAGRSKPETTSASQSSAVEIRPKPSIQEQPAQVQAEIQVKRLHEARVAQQRQWLAWQQSNVLYQQQQQQMMLYQRAMHQQMSWQFQQAIASQMVNQTALSAAVYQLKVPVITQFSWQRDATGRAVQGIQINDVQGHFLINQFTNGYVQVDPDNLQSIQLASTVLANAYKSGNTNPIRINLPKEEQRNVAIQHLEDLGVPRDAIRIMVKDPETNQLVERILPKRKPTSGTEETLGDRARVTPSPLL